MKKNFREVIRDIKPGEVWEGISKKIICYPAGEIEIKSVSENLKFGRSVTLTNDTLFKLKRKEYTFAEAFAAYEEGKEIESKETKFKYRRILGKDKYYNAIEKEWAENRVFSTEEIRDKWFING